jgi:hypothetical protein
VSFVILASLTGGVDGAIGLTALFSAISLGPARISPSSSLAK